MLRAVSPILAVAFYWAILAGDLSAAEPARKPNVIVFLVDDMGWIDCGAYGSQYYETPNIDRFAKRAMRFTDAYAQPLCSPTRACLLTGKASARHGITSASGHQPPQAPSHQFLPESGPPNRAVVTPESKNYLEPSEFTLAEAFQSAGWRTAHIGKWHLGLTQPYWPEKQGFDVAFHAHPDPGPSSYFSPYNVATSGSKAAKGQRMGNITDGPPGEYIVDRLTDEAIKFIEANKDRPFFLDLWQYGVHGPWGHKEEYTKQFVSKKDPTGRQSNPIMASMLKSVDESFGRVLDTLDRLKLTENTIVVFNSDNGGNVHSNTEEDRRAKKAAENEAKGALIKDWQKWAGNQPPTNNTPLRNGKGTLYEGGVRVPLMWSWAGAIKPGAVSSEVVGAIDLYPTLLEIVGLPRAQEQVMDGVSYASVLRSAGKLNREAYFNYFPHGGPGKPPGVTVRAGDWKLIRWFETSAEYPNRHELYNLKDDLGESKNLASAMPDKVRQLDGRIDAFLKETGATFPKPNPKYQARAAERSTYFVAAPGDSSPNEKLQRESPSIKDAKAEQAWLDHGFTSAQRGKIQSAFAKGIEQKFIPGGALLIMHRGEPVLREAFGVVSLESQAPFTIDAPCRIASVTKPHSATLLAMLVEQGKLAWDDPIEKHLPYFAGIGVRSKAAATRTPKVRELLSHTAGFPGQAAIDAGDWQIKMDGTLAGAVEALPKQGLAAEPGTVYAYTGLGYMVAGRIAEVVTGQEYGSLMHDLLLAPISADTATFRPNSELQARMPTAYERKEGMLVKLDPASRRGAAAKFPNPAGSLVSTLDDVGRFMMLHRDRGMANGKRLVAPESLLALYRRQPATEKMNYGLGFNVVKINQQGDGVRVRHTGASGTWAELDFENDVIVVILTQVPQTQTQPFREPLLKAIGEVFNPGQRPAK